MRCRSRSAIALPPRREKPLQPYRVSAHAARECRLRQHRVPAPELAETADIADVSLYVEHDGRPGQPESEIADVDAFYDELRSAERLPTTSHPRVEDFVAVCEQLVAAGDEVVSVHISGGLPARARRRAPRSTRCAGAGASGCG
jgi:hypothetical protein